MPCSVHVIWMRLNVDCNYRYRIRESPIDAGNQQLIGDNVHQARMTLNKLQDHATIHRAVVDDVKTLRSATTPHNSSPLHRDANRSVDGRRWQLQFFELLRANYTSSRAHTRQSSSICDVDDTLMIDRTGWILGAETGRAEFRLCLCV